MRGDSPGNQILLLQLVTDGLRSVLFDEPGPRADSLDRSEEHTSELSHGYISYAVFCLKKKKKIKQKYILIIKYQQITIEYVYQFYNSFTRLSAIATYLLIVTHYLYVPIVRTTARI